jgi:hypothetical protein
MSLLCFSMDLHRTREEVAATAEMTEMAYGAWVLVNDYFSWEKEWKNYTANGSVGLIVSAVWFFTKWHSVDAEESKRMVRKEIMAREEKYEQMRDEFLARGNHSQKTLEWINLLDNVTAGNFLWSMTTARYHTDVEDSYPGLRKAHLEKDTSDKVDSLSIPISVNAAGEEARHDSCVGTPTKSQTHDPQIRELAPDGAINDGSDLTTPEEPSGSRLVDFEAVSTSTTARQLNTNNRRDCTRAIPIHRINAVERREELGDRWSRSLVQSSGEVVSDNPRDSDFVTQLFPHVSSRTQLPDIHHTDDHVPGLTTSKTTLSSDAECPRRTRCSALPKPSTRPIY